MQYLPDLSFEYKAAIREAILSENRIAVSYSISQCPHPAALDAYCHELDQLLAKKQPTHRVFWHKAVSAITADKPGKVGITFYAEDITLDYEVIEFEDFDRYGASEEEDSFETGFADIEGRSPLLCD